MGRKARARQLSPSTHHPPPPSVGGYLPHCPPRPTQPGFAKLRTARVLAEGMYITVEPGCYMIDVLLDAALADPAREKFLVKPVIARLRRIGGVRLEDDVLITAGGCEVFSIVPRTRADVEGVVQGRIKGLGELTRFHGVGVVGPACTPHTTLPGGNLGTGLRSSSAQRWLQFDSILAVHCSRALLYSSSCAA